MGEVTITVPAELAPTFRENAFTLYQSRADGLNVTLRNYLTGQGAPNEVQLERGALGAVEPVLGQIDWRLAHGEEAPLTITADAALLRAVLGGCLVDAGSNLDGECQWANPSRSKLVSALAQVEWFSKAIDDLGLEPAAVA